MNRIALRESRLLHELLLAREKGAAADRVAITHGGASLSYRELAARYAPSRVAFPLPACGVAIASPSIWTNGPSS
jgi:hypothetical protein